MSIAIIWSITILTLLLLLYTHHVYAGLGALVSFGNSETDQELKTRVVKQYGRQQWIAFVVLVFAVLASLGFATYLVWRFITLKTFDLEVLSSAVGIAADLFLGRAAFRLYRDVSDRLEKLLK